MEDKANSDAESISVEKDCYPPNQRMPPDVTLVISLSRENERLRSLIREACEDASSDGNDIRSVIADLLDARDRAEAAIRTARQILDADDSDSLAEIAKYRMEQIARLSKDSLYWIHLVQSIAEVVEAEFPIPILSTVKRMKEELESARKTIRKYREITGDTGQGDQTK